MDLKRKRAIEVFYILFGAFELFVAFYHYRTVSSVRLFCLFERLAVIFLPSCSSRFIQPMLAFVFFYLYHEPLTWAQSSTTLYLYHGIACVFFNFIMSFFILLGKGSKYGVSLWRTHLHTHTHIQIYKKHKKKNRKTKVGL